MAMIIARNGNDNGHTGHNNGNNDGHNGNNNGHNGNDNGHKEATDSAIPAQDGGGRGGYVPCLEEDVPDSTLATMANVYFICWRRRTGQHSHNWMPLPLLERSVVVLGDCVRSMTAGSQPSQNREAPRLFLGAASAASAASADGLA